MAVWNVIDHTELSGNAASYNVTSIPSSYDHLYLVTSIRTDDVVYFDQLGLRLNGDTGTNYSWTRLNAGTTTPSSGTGTGDTSIEYLYGATGTSALADTFGTMTTWIPNYANTANFKQTHHQWTQPNNSTTDYQWFIGMIAGLWQDTSAVNQITLTPLDGDNFVQYSTFTLYGINGAG
jgi:hypothetical protein